MDISYFLCLICLGRLQPRVHLLGPAVAEASALEQVRPVRLRYEFTFIAIQDFLRFNRCLFLASFDRCRLISYSGLQAAPPDAVRASAEFAAAAAYAIAPSRFQLTADCPSLPRASSLDSCASTAEAGGSGWGPQAAAALATAGWAVVTPPPQRAASCPEARAGHGAAVLGGAGSVVLELHPTLAQSEVPLRRRRSM